jgi:hypothetical protein
MRGDGIMRTLRVPVGIKGKLGYLVVGALVYVSIVAAEGCPTTPSQTTSDCQLGFHANSSSCRAQADYVGCRSHTYTSSSGACNGSRCNVGCKP